MTINFQNKMMTGGFTSRNMDVTDLMFSTEDGITFHEVGRLPSARGGHCLIVLDEDTLFLAGGIDGSGIALSDAWLYSSESGYTLIN